MINFLIDFCVYFYTHKIVPWVNAVFNLSFATPTDHVVAMSIMIVVGMCILFAYRNNIKLLLWLVFGMGCVGWPGVVGYACPRYLHLIYPLVIFTIVYGIYLNRSFGFDFAHHERFLSPLALSLSKGTSVILLLFSLFLTIQGLRTNRVQLHDMAYERWEYKKRFDIFFKNNFFSSRANFILLSSPFVSDIQSIFQMYLNNLSTTVAFDPFTTLAQTGIMGCRDDYRIVGVSSSVMPIAGGFRLTSHDPYCGWWLRCSDFPVKWSARDRAYMWTDQPYQAGTLYECSIGTFFIYSMAGPDCVTDMAIYIDKEWINAHTVFVVWNTVKGEYQVIS